MNNEEILNDIINDFPKKYKKQIEESLYNRSDLSGSFIISNVVYIWTINESIMRGLAFEKLYKFLHQPITEYIDDIYMWAIDEIIDEYGIFYIMLGFEGKFEETKNGILYFRKPIETKV